MMGREKKERTRDSKKHKVASTLMIKIERRTPLKAETRQWPFSVLDSCFLLLSFPFYFLNPFLNRLSHDAGNQFTSFTGGGQCGPVTLTVGDYHPRDLSQVNSHTSVTSGRWCDQPPNGVTGAVWHSEKGKQRERESSYCEFKKLPSTHLLICG